ncbi:MAG: hypothetical protein EOT04_02250, partial [Candidatus Chaera renei]
RPLRRAMQDNVEHLIADGIIAGRYQKGDVISVDAAKDSLVLKVVQE